MVIRKIYKRYFFDFCIVYSKLRKDKDEANAAYISISRIQAIFIWGILIFHKAIYGDENDNYIVILTIIGGSMILTHLINYKWVKEFKKWKKEIPQKKKLFIRWNNFYLLSTLFILLFFFSGLLLLLYNTQRGAIL